MRTLNTFVYVNEAWYGPGSVVPDEVATQITNPKVWDGDPPPASVDPAQEPPRGGPGSGVDAWRVFLTGQGITDLPAEASRDDLVALWDARD